VNSTLSLTKERIRQLLAAVGSQPRSEPTPEEVTEYNWHQPHYFSREQLGILESFTKNFAAAIAQKFTQLCHCNFDVTILSTTQHFVGELLGQTRLPDGQVTGSVHAPASSTARRGGGQNDYYLAFARLPDGQGHRQPPAQGRGLISPATCGRGCGFISIPEKTAIAWVTQLLGETEPAKGSPKVLSQLEESLLLDIAASIVAALSASVCRLGYFEPATNIVRGELPFELSEGPRFAGTGEAQELCKITFSVGKTGSDSRSEAVLVISCSELAPIVGETFQPPSAQGPRLISPRSGAGGLSAENVSKAIMEHLYQMPVSITAQLASTALAFEELVGLAPCDILLLDRAIDEPMELIVDGRTIFRGRPARLSGQYAVVITEAVGDKVQM